MKKSASLEDLIEITNEILRAKYRKAELAFLAGSIVRGEGTAFSDLDLVVIFKEMPNAFRESFYFGGRPVEVFAHTPETLNYFMSESDRSSGIPSMAQMVSEGVEIPEKSDLSKKLKRLAQNCLKLKPPALPPEELDQRRYRITNLIDDIREPRSKEELTASATELYAALADFYFRANRLWSGRNKSIPRVFEKTNPELRREFCDGFEELFVHGKSARVIELTEKLLAPHGGFLFETERLSAPPEQRKPLEDEDFNEIEITDERK